MFGVTRLAASQLAARPASRDAAPDAARKRERRRGHIGLSHTDVAPADAGRVPPPQSHTLLTGSGAARFARGIHADGACRSICASLNTRCQRSASSPAAAMVLDAAVQRASRAAS